MAYDAYGRPQRGTGEPGGYFEFNHAASDYTPNINPNSRGDELRRTESNARKRTSPPINERSTFAADRVEPAGNDGVSPELIAAITEKVKREGK